MYHTCPTVTFSFGSTDLFQSMLFFQGGTVIMQVCCLVRYAHSDCLKCPSRISIKFGTHIKCMSLLTSKRSRIF